jgi:hypothetical protein
MRIAAAAILVLGMTGGAVMAAAVPPQAVNGSVPLSQVTDPPDRVATARVTDADGKVIGAVQKVELRDGRPFRLDIALLGSENTVMLDAAAARYDAGANVVATTESVSQLMARPQT